MPLEGNGAVNLSKFTSSLQCQNRQITEKDKISIGIQKIPIIQACNLRYSCQLQTSSSQKFPCVLNSEISLCSSRPSLYKSSPEGQLWGLSWPPGFLNARMVMQKCALLQP